MTARLGHDLVDIMEGLPVGVFRTSVDGEIVAVNHALAALLGYDDPGQVLGLFAGDFYADPEQRNQGMTGLRSTGEVHGLEFALRRRDGSLVWVRESARAVYADDGSVVCYEGVLEDITDIHEARRELEKSEEMFRSAFEEAPIGMSIGHADLRPRRVNAAFTRITGYTDAEARDLTLEQLVHPDSLEEAEQRRDEIGVEVTEPYRAERLLRHKDGHPINALLGVSPIYDAEDRLIAVLSQFVDITELRKAQEAAAAAEAQNRALLDAIPDQLFRIDRRGTVLGVRHPEPPFRRYVGRNVRDLFPEAAVEAMATIEAAFIAGGTQEMRLTVEGAGGESLTYEARVTAIDDDEVVAIVRNVTRQLEEQEALEHLVRAKDDFVAAVSHELRTPLTTVVGLAFELRDRRAELSESDTEEMIDLLADQSREMFDLVEDLLVAARADMGQMAVDLARIELGAEVSAVVQAFPIGSATIEPATEVYALGDAVRVRQIVRNLITNAVRYGGDDVRVRFAADPQRAVVEVRDDGPGIPESEVDRIFERYYRGTPSKAVPAAVGIGLSVSRDLARLMSGDLTYGREGRDSVFRLELPVD